MIGTRTIRSARWFVVSMIGCSAPPPPESPFLALLPGREAIATKTDSLQAESAAGSFAKVREYARLEVAELVTALWRASNCEDAQREARTLARIVAGVVGESVTAETVETLTRDRVDGTNSAALARAAEEATSCGASWFAARFELLRAAIEDGATEPDERKVTSTSNDAWTSAVRHGAALVRAPLRVRDPSFWERAIVLRRAREWPAEVIESLDPWSPIRHDEVIEERDPARFDSVVARFAANCRFERHEFAAALAGFRAARSRALDRRSSEMATIGEARALAALGAMDEARAHLFENLRNLEESDPQVVSESLAWLGAFELLARREDRAIAFLRAALLRNGATFEFPARSDAIANLGIALLSTCRTEEGLAVLREAETCYEAAGDLSGASKVLRNLRVFHSVGGHVSSVESIDERLVVLERTGIEVGQAEAPRARPVSGG